ncbi:MAG: hypothetical protein ACMXYA_00515 [Candidatus Woesearchaeota archaeon]
MQNSLQLQFEKAELDYRIYKTLDGQEWFYFDDYEKLRKTKIRGYKFFYPKNCSEQQLRTVIKKSWCTAILNPDEFGERKSQKQYDSLISHVVCKMCAEKHIAIFVTFDSLKTVPRPDYLSRIIQTRRLCKKYKTTHTLLVLLSQSEKPYGQKDIDAVFSVLDVQ